MNPFQRVLWMVPVLGIAVLLAQPSSAEWFADFYVGGNFSQEAGLSIPPQNLQQALEQKPANSVLIGGRFGKWFESRPWLGVAVDASFFQPDLGDADVNAVPLSALLMLRLQLMPDKDFPRGTFQPYAAVGAGLFFSDIDLNLSGLGLSGSYSDRSLDPGLDFRLGFLANLTKQWGIFVEYRFTYFEPDYNDRVQGETLSIEPDFKTHHANLGISYRF